MDEPMKKYPVIRHIRWSISMWRLSRRYRLYERIHKDNPYPVNVGRDHVEIDEIWDGKR